MDEYKMKIGDIGIAKEIVTGIGRALESLGIEFDVSEIELEHPNLEEHGDYATNVALKFKSQNRSVRELAEKVVKLLAEDQSLLRMVQRIEIAGPGFINFWLKEEYLISEIQKIINTEEKYGKSGLLKNRKIMVEYGHPNTHKEMHIGHMRTLITGEAIARILEFSGAQVFRANYQGDIGPHVAKAIWGTQKILQEQNQTCQDADQLSAEEKARLLGQGYVRGSQEYEKYKQELDNLNKDLYQVINVSDNEFNRADSNSVPVSLSLSAIYRLTRQWSLDYYDQFYQRFGTKYDKLYFESQVAKLGQQIVLDNVGKVFEESNKAIIFNGEPHGLHTRVFITADGNSTYEAKEIGLAPEQYGDFPFDQNIHVVANEQAGYFQVVFKALELIDPKFKNREFHLSMGMVNLVGMKMSSRTGVVITVDGLLEEIKQQLQPFINNPDLSTQEKQDIAEQGTLGAVKYSVLKTSPTMNISFDIKKSIDLQGNSGPYIQYTHARCRSVFEKSNTKNKISKIDWKLKIENCKLNAEEVSILRHLYRFPEVVVQSAQEYAPNYVCVYLYELAQRYNKFYSKHSILSADNDSQKILRLCITSSVGQVLLNGMQLLGVVAPEKM